MTDKKLSKRIFAYIIDSTIVLLLTTLIINIKYLNPTYDTALEKSNILIIDVKYNEKIVSKIEVTEKEKNKIKELIDECSLKIEKLNTIKQKNIRKNIEI